MMNDELISRIYDHVVSLLGSPPFRVATVSMIEKTEAELGFALPPLLKECYKVISNGGFGPGYGLIGLKNGAESDFGSLLDTYVQLKSDQEILGKKWKRTLLPFCDWGCNIFSCVDCDDIDFGIYTFQDSEVMQQEYSLDMFFEFWLKGIDILSINSEGVEKEIINPFTGDKDTIRRPKK